MYIGLVVGPIRKKQPRSLIESSVNVVCHGLFTRMRNSSEEQQNKTRYWLSDLPGIKKSAVMKLLYKQIRGSNLWPRDGHSTLPEFTRLDDT